MTEESMLRYRLDVVQTMPHGPYKAALVTAIAFRMAALLKTTRMVLSR
jgi:hypothetical protein